MALPSHQSATLWETPHGPDGPHQSNPPPPNPPPVFHPISIQFQLLTPHPHSGPNWIGYLTTTYNASTLLTYNLAYGGATIDSTLVKPWRDDVLSLTNQVEDLFLAHLGSHPASTPWKSDNSLFTFFIGINDIGNSYWLGDFDNFHNKLMDVYFGLINKVPLPPSPFPPPPNTSHSPQSPYS